MAPPAKVGELNVVLRSKEGDVASSLREIREVLGFSLASAGGALTHEGLCDDRFQERMVYFTHLGNLVGRELGLEPLREMHIVGESKRFAAFLARDGSRTTVVTESGYETQALSRLLGK